MLYSAFGIAYLSRARGFRVFRMLLARSPAETRRYRTISVAREIFRGTIWSKLVFSIGLVSSSRLLALIPVQDLRICSSVQPFRSDPSVLSSPVGGQFGISSIGYCFAFVEVELQILGWLVKNSYNHSLCIREYSIAINPYLRVLAAPSVWGGTRG